jgi:polysaccharide biosynthesis transport protein
MTLFQLLTILAARRKIFLATFFTVVSITVLYNILAPKEYTASTKVVLNNKVVDPVTGISLASSMIENFMATQLQVLQSDAVALEVVKRLRLTDSPDIKQKFKDSNGGKGDINLWLARLLVSNLNVIFNKSNVIEISYSAADPQFAAVIANAFTVVYIEKSIRLKTEPAQKAASYLNQQAQSLRNDFEQAQAKLSNFQKEHGLTSNNDSVDVESARLNEMSAQLSIAQAELVEANSRFHDMQKNANDSPDVAQSALVQNLKIELSKAESNLASVSGTLSENHPQYIALSSQIEKLRRQLAGEIAKVASNVRGTANISTERVAVLKQQVEQQKQKVLNLNQVRGEMISLQNDVLSAQAALDSANRLYGQNNIEGQSDQGNIALLDTATPPFNSSSPKVIMNIFFSILGGIFLGLLFAMISELLNRKVRGTQDLTDLIDAPIFVISNTKKSTNLLTKLTRNNKLLPLA